MDLSLLGLWHAMGNFAKGIVIVMVIMSIYSLTVMVSKWWNLRKAQKETIKFAPEFSQFLEEDNLTEAIRLAESYKKSHVALVLGGALGEVKPLIADGSVTVSDINSAERAVERNMLLEITSLKRGLAVLATVGATAPFVGLFGTVWGVYHALVAIGVSGAGTLDRVAGPVGEALIMTGLGLAVAIPAVVGYNWLTRTNRVLIAKLDAFAYELHTFVSMGQPLGSGAGSGAEGGAASNVRGLARPAAA